MSDFPASRFHPRNWLQGRLAFLTVLLLFAGSAIAQAPGSGFTPNFRDADFIDVVKAVSEVTGKNFIIDPRVHARVTLYSSTEMSSQAFYEAFLAVARAHGFVTRSYGNLVTISVDTKTLTKKKLPELLRINRPDRANSSGVVVPEVGS